LEFKIDSYQVFTLKANNLAKNGGCISYIIPSGLMDNFFSKKIRKNLIAKNIIEIIELDDSVFKEAVVHSMIITWKTNNTENYSISCNVGSLKKQNAYIANSDFFIKEENHNFALRKVQYSDLISKLETNIFRLEDVLKIKDGIDTGNNSLYVSNEPINGWKKLIGGSDIDRWEIKSNRYVNYGTHLANPRNPELFENDKIIIRETGNRIIATVDFNSNYALSTLYSGYIINDYFSLKSLLALLNSEISHFLMFLLAFGRTKGAFTKTRIFHYYSIPVKKDIAEYSILIDITVDCLLNLKKLKISKDKTDFLENFLNIIFYLIYFKSDFSKSDFDFINKTQNQLKDKKANSLIEIDSIITIISKEGVDDISRTVSALKEVVIIREIN